MAASGGYEQGTAQRLCSHLTKGEMACMLEVIHEALTVNTDKQLHDLLASVARLLPCERVVCGAARTEAQGRPGEILKVQNVSYPADWLALYLRENFLAVDPIVRTHFTRFGTQVWSDTFRRVVSRPEREFIGLAAAFGLREGVTLGLHDPRQRRRTLFSFAGVAMGEHPRHALVLEHLVPHLHAALVRTMAAAAPAAVSLSAREREVLQWMKEGRSNWEIAQIIGVSERTVRFHVGNILQKLQALTRGHAVALAMEQGLIPW
jgi:DNA-binding CsgD family transcriptional regulator